MTIGAWISTKTKELEKANIATARLDCLVLLSAEIGRDKSWVLAHPEYELQIEQIEKLSTKITQRAQHMPLAYLRGKCEFYGREFVVNADVLVPRPDSESMVELLKRVASRESRTTVIDVGTGSGCLAITAKLELSNVQVIAIDIDNSCLAIAQKNADKLGAKVHFLQGDLLQPIRDSRLETRGSIVLANLPYIPLGYPINQAATHEPRLALYSGTDGLDHYRDLFASAETLPASPAHIITEALQVQHKDLAAIAMQHGYKLKETDGLAQLFSLIQ